MYTQVQLVEQIKQLGIIETDYVTVHLSLKSVGAIDTSEKTGADVFIDALKACVPDGLLVIPAHTYKSTMEEHVFHIESTMPCIGIVPTVAVKRANQAYKIGDENCVRSFHPSHSVVAFGKNATKFTAEDRFASTPMPSFGCYRKLYQYGAKILLVGVGLNNNTFIHMVDEYFAPEELGPEFGVTCIDYEGKHHMRTMRSCRGPSRCYPQYQPILDAAGALTYGKIGDANVILCDARKTFEAILKAKNEGFKLDPSLNQ